MKQIFVQVLESPAHPMLVGSTCRVVDMDFIPFSEGSRARPWIEIESPSGKHRTLLSFNQVRIAR